MFVDNIPAYQQLNSVKSCTVRVPSLSLAMHCAHDNGLRRRELWAQESKLRNVAMMSAPNVGSVSKVRSCMRSMAICKPEALLSLHKPFNHRSTNL